MMAARQKALTEQRDTLFLYLRSKLDANDLHGVMDAAADIREIDARLDELARVAPPLESPMWGGLTSVPSAPSAVTPVPQCDAVVMGGRCVMVEGHQGDHMNADEWRAEAH
jgi:hypothetical protein